MSSNLARRDLLKLMGLSGLSWLTPLGQLLAREADAMRVPARSVIVLWLAGGPSQLETFDPHPGKNIAAGSEAMATRARGVQLAKGFEQLADQMDAVSVIRSLVSKEGDHERGTYTIKTGYRPDPTLTHPALGAIVCHELPAGGVDIPRHVSILPGQWPARGGFLGDQHDAFKVYDPAEKLPDVSLRVSPERDQRRYQSLSVIEEAFAKGRQGRVESTAHRATLERARAMMTSQQLKAFDTSDEPLAVRRAYGDTPFGRGCLAARRLIEVGVRCVEVTLDGWDTHVNNHAIVKNLVAILDPAFAALLRDLKERRLLDRTVVLCLGEFGRTPKLNPASGRDHWPDGFSMALAGGGLRGGLAVGQTDPDGGKLAYDANIHIADVYATVLNTLGINPGKHNQAVISQSGTSRPMALTDGGKVLRQVLQS